MASEWRASTWGEEIALEYGKALRSHHDSQGQYRVFGSNGPIGWTSEPLSSGPGVILGRKGAYRGVEYSRDPFFVIDTAYYVVPKTQSDMRWLYYAIMHYKLGEVDDGSPIPSTTRAAVYMLDLDVPPPDEQRAIAQILGTFDDRIEVNRLMSETLEAMARALFKSWFIDFDPVRAKADGRDPGLPEPVASLFPVRFVDSELGAIPAGWRVGSLEDVASVIMGLSPDGATYNVDGVGTPLINGPVEFGDHFPAKTKWTTSPTRLAEIGDLILCVRGSTTGRRVVADDVYCLGRGVCAVRAKAGARTFLYQAVNRSVDRLLSKTTGSVFPNLSAPDIKGFQIIVPPPELIDAFKSIAEPLTVRVEANVRESRNLAVLRDTLLPRLISGKMQVTDPVRFLEGAGA